MRKTCDFDAARNINTPVGVLGLCARGGRLVAVKFAAVDEFGWDPALDIVQRQLEEYFAGTRRDFQVPMDAGGTAFQRKCWQALLEIPYGESRSYSDIAQQVGSPKGVRAVGMANHVNPIPVIIPCHRVVGKDGDLTGYAGGLEMKKWLLDHEKRNK